jgi:hypothetical protein
MLRRFIASRDATSDAGPKTDRRRRAFVPRPEGMEERRCPSTVRLVGGVLKINGGPAANTVVIQQDDAANVIRVRYDFQMHRAHSRTARLHTRTFASSRISSIVVSLGGPSDSFRYELQSDLTRAKSIQVGLGPGNNQADVDLDSGSSHTIHANLLIDITGGAGTNVLNVDQTNKASARAVNVDPGAVLRLNLNGGPGSDLIKLAYQGQLNGYLDLRAGGGTGVDQGTVDVHIVPGSFGSASVLLDKPSNVPPAISLHPVIDLGSLIGLQASPLDAAPAASVIVNNHPLSQAELQSLAQTLRMLSPSGNGVPFLPGRFWYDPVSGAIGLMGQGTGGFLPPNLTALGTAPADASLGSSGVFINGREITGPHDPVMRPPGGLDELTFLERLINGLIVPGNYFLHANGDAGVINPDGSEGPVLLNLVQLARTQGGANRAGDTRPGPFSTYDLTGVAVFADNSILDANPIESTEED